MYAGRLLNIKVDPDTSIGTRCARNCPVSAINRQARETYTIDPEICIRYGICAQVCPVNAFHID